MRQKIWLKVEDSLNILNLALRIVHTLDEAKTGLEDFLIRLGKTLKKVDCIKPHLHNSQTSTDILEKLATAIDIFRILLTITRDCLIVFHLSELVLK